MLINYSISVANNVFSFRIAKTVTSEKCAGQRAQPTTVSHSNQGTDERTFFNVLFLSSTKRHTLTPGSLVTPPGS